MWRDGIILPGVHSRPINYFIICWTWQYIKQVNNWYNIRIKFSNDFQLNFFKWIKAGSGWFHYRLNKKSISYFECQLFTLNTLSDIPSRILGNIFPEIRMASALTISILADLLDYTAGPLLGMPIVGDVFDLIVMSFAFFYN